MTTFAINMTAAASRSFGSVVADPANMTAADVVALHTAASSVANGEPVATVDDGAITRGNRSSARSIVRRLADMIDDARSDMSDAVAVDTADDTDTDADVPAFVVWCDHAAAVKSNRAALTGAGFVYVSRQTNMDELRALRGIGAGPAYRAARARFVAFTTSPDTVAAVDAVDAVDGVTVGAWTGADPAAYNVAGSADCLTHDGRTRRADADATAAAA